MDPATHIAHLRGRRGAAARRVPRGTRTPPVATCPPWDRAALLHHVAGAHSWHRGAGRARPERAGALQAEPAGPGGRRPAGLVRRQRARPGRRARRRWTPTRTWPTWAGDRPGIVLPAPHGPGDRRAPLGRASAVRSTPTLAVDGIDEHLGLFAPARPGRQPCRGTARSTSTPPTSTASGSSTLGPSGISFEHGHAKGDVALRGTAERPAAVAWNRVPVDDRFEVFGDRDLLDVWRTAVRDLDALRDRRRRAGCRCSDAPASGAWSTVLVLLDELLQAGVVDRVERAAGEPTRWRRPPRRRRARRRARRGLRRSSRARSWMHLDVRGRRGRASRRATRRRARGRGRRSRPGPARRRTRSSTRPGRACLRPADAARSRPRRRLRCAPGRE